MAVARMKAIGAVSFDLDGTLCDHQGAVRLSFDAALRALVRLVPGAPAAAVKQHFGIAGSRMKRMADEAGQPWWPVRDQWAEALREAGVVCSAELLDEVASVFTHTLNTTAIAYPDAHQVLVSLRRTGLPVGVLTNGNRGNQLRKLRACGLEDLVDRIVVSEDIGVHKPDAAAFSAMARALSVPLGALVHVGDDLVHDVDGATAAGARAVWVVRSGRAGPGPATPRAGAAPRVFDLTSVPPLLGALRFVHRRPS
ncbi:putative HAD superfamily hydrolase [Streptomyces sp. W007]|nr:putative HAD superfamily hydrolase [Streptomyces sp. W007]